MIAAAVYAHTLRELLGPVQPYLDDPNVSEVLINGPDTVYIERAGRLQPVPAAFASSDALLSAINAIAQYAGRVVDAREPILEARLPDGSRVEAVLSPAARGGHCVAIRRYSRTPLTLDALIDKGALTQDAAAALALLIEHKQNVIVSGGTGSGKTSLLNALSSFIPEHERVVVIEDASELQLQRPHVVQLESQPGDAKGRGRVGIGELFRATLRLRPDRIVVGEVRGAEAIELIQAMSSGHGGCMSSLHASYPLDALHRLETMALMSSLALPLTALRAQIASAVDVIVQVDRLRDGQRVVTDVVDVQHGPDGYALTPLFTRHNADLHATGALPHCASRLHALGLRLPRAMYQAGET